MQFSTAAPQNRSLCRHLKGLATSTGGHLYLFDRRSVRFFRKDGHNWRKKADGKTVRETHEKLKVPSAPALPLGPSVWHHMVLRKL